MVYFCTMPSIHDIDFSPEITYKTSRSGGKGGQHANKTETRVELRFSIPTSQLLTDEQKELLLERLASRLTQDGELLITVEEERSQVRNKAIAYARFYEVLEEALKPKKKRKKTKPPPQVDEKRLEEKKKTSEKKEKRKPPSIPPYEA